MPWGAAWSAPKQIDELLDTEAGVGNDPTQGARERRPLRKAGRDEASDDSQPDDEK